MFFLLALVSMTAYSLHNVWMAPYYRRFDQMVTVTVRGYALSMAMLPGLLIPGLAGLTRVPEYAPRILAASACALVGNWAGASAVRHLPIGIASALNSSLATVVSAVLSARFLGETLSSGQWLWIGAIFAGTFALGAIRSPIERTVEQHLGKGVLLTCLFGLALGTAFTLISSVARTLHPLVAGFCWETTIATFGALYVLLRHRRIAGLLAGLTKPDLGWIALYGIPGAVGTGCYALAVNGGPVAIVGAILTTTMVATSVLAWLLYGERLYVVQWALVGFVCLALIGMRFA